MVNRDRTDRIPRRDDVPEEGAGRPRRDPRPDRLARDPASEAQRRTLSGPGPWETDPVDVDRYIDERAEEPMPSRTPRRSGTASGAGATGTGGDFSPHAFPPAAASARPGRRNDGVDPGWSEETNAPDLEDEEKRFSAPPVAPPHTRRAATRSRSRGPTRPAPSLPRPRVPAAIAKADLVNDSLALALIGVGTFGLLVMATIMGNRLDTLPPVLELRFDAVGSPYRWGVPRTLWNLPLLSTMILLMNVVVAWFVSPHDRFASRFCIAAALVVQLLVWVPAIRFLW